MNQGEEMEQILEQTQLNDKQRMFCLYYLKSFNATKAYHRAYQCSLQSADANAYRLMQNPIIRDTIKALKRLKFQQILLEREDIVERFIEIAFSDITDFLSYRTEQVPVVNGKGEVKTFQNPQTGEQEILTEAVDVIHFKPSQEINGHLIAEVSQSTGGLKLKLHDQVKALQWLYENLGNQQENRGEDDPLTKSIREAVAHGVF